MIQTAALRWIDGKVESSLLPSFQVKKGTILYVVRSDGLSHMSLKEEPGAIKARCAKCVSEDNIFVFDGCAVTYYLEPVT